MAFSAETRAAAFRRAGGKCECEMRHCGHRGRCGKPLGTNWEAHHAHSVAAGGHDGLSNCVAMCKACHQNTHSYGRS
jgi:5-methylcytosine-specific restriction endonuclease McrA